MSILEMDIIYILCNSTASKRIVEYLLTLRYQRLAGPTEGLIIAGLRICFHFEGRDFPTGGVRIASASKDKARDLPGSDVANVVRAIDHHRDYASLELIEVYGSTVWRLLLF